MHTLTPLRLTVAAALLAAALALPSSAAAATSACSVDGDAGLDQSTLSATTSRPTISGEISGTRSVQVTLRRSGEEKTIYVSKTVRVRGGEWSLRIPKKLRDGTYDVEVFCPKVRRGTSVAEGELVVGAPAKAKSSVSVTPIALLMGGTASAGESVPVAYLKVSNTGKSAAKLESFSVRQTGTASAKAIASLTVVDGSGTSRVTTDASFKDGVAVAGTDVTIAPGKFKLFTIKANLASSLGADAGKNLKIEVASAKGAASFSAKFPIKGVTWTLR